MRTKLGTLFLSLFIFLFNISSTANEVEIISDNIKIIENGNIIKSTNSKAIIKKKKLTLQSLVSVYDKKKQEIYLEEKDITPLLKSKEKINFFLKNYPNTEYALDLKFKLDLINNQLAAKELFVAKYYIQTQKWIAAINRLKTIVENYNETIFIEEALHRLTEIYYKIGLIEEAEATVALLGYNYNSGEWYERSYKILNKNYQIQKKKKIKKKDDGLIKRTIKRILE